MNRHRSLIRRQYNFSLSIPMQFDKAIRLAQACEAQLGVGALHRARLGIAIVEGRQSLMDLNARIAQASGDDDDDPR